MQFCFANFSMKIAPKEKKLRDVLQEREGTSLNYLEVFLSNSTPNLQTQLNFSWTE